MKSLPRVAPAPVIKGMPVAEPPSQLPRSFKIGKQIKARNESKTRAPRSRGFHPSELHSMCPVKFYLYDQAIEDLAHPDPERITAAASVIHRVLNTEHDGVRPGKAPQRLLADFHVGDAIHEWTQFSYGEAGYLWGMWRCPHCRAVTQPGFMPRMEILDLHGNPLKVAAYCTACKGGNYLAQHRQVKWVYVEPWMGMPEWELQGHCDGILLIPFEGVLVPFILEIKSINENGYFERYGDPLPKPEHVLQASQYVWAGRQTFAWLRELRHIYFCYVNKNAVRDSKEFVTPADLNVVERMTFNMRTVLDAKRTETIPEHARVCASVDAPEARKCPLVFECLGERPPANLFDPLFNFETESETE